MSFALFGGTFDPLHIGHLMIAEQIRELKNLEKIIFLPLNIAPHKKQNTLSNTEHRINMLKLGIADNPAFQISLREIERSGVSYTIITLREIYKETGENPYFIIGADSLKQFATWREPEEILRLSRILVILRPDYDLKKDNYKYEKYIDKIEFLENINQIYLSASQIREHIRKGKSIRYLIPKSIEEYIYQNKLYIK